MDAAEIRGWEPEQLERAHGLAVSGLQRLVAGGGRSLAPAGSLAPTLIDWLTGAELDPDYKAMLAEELGVTGDPRVDPLSHTPMASVDLASALEIGAADVIMAVWDRRLHAGAVAESLSLAPSSLPHA